MRPWLAAVLSLLLLAGREAMAREPERVGVRVGSHSNFGRVVFDWPARVEYHAERDGDRLLLRFAADADLNLGAIRRPPRNVLELQRREGAVEIRLAPGSSVRHFHLDDRIVVDVLDAVPASRSRQATRSADAGSAARRAVPPRAGTVPRAEPRREPAPEPRASIEGRAAEVAAVPAAASAPPVSTPPMAVLREEVPPTDAPTRPRSVPVRLFLRNAAERAILVRFPDPVGVAVLRRGPAMLVIFDVATPLDLSGLRGDPVVGAAEAQVMEGATVLRVPLAEPGSLVPRLEEGGWTFQVATDARPLVGDASFGAGRIPEGTASLSDGLVFPAAHPGRVITLTDPETGSPLLVATLRQDEQRAIQARRLPELELLPTVLGIAVLPRADHIVLRAKPDHIALEGAGGVPLHLGEPPGEAPPPEAAAMSRVLDLPPLATPALLARLRLQEAAIAAAPPLLRGTARRDAAETLLSLGLPQEAQAMAALALSEDPRAATDPRLLFTRAAAALLAGRLAEAGDLDGLLPSTDETTLWRGLRTAVAGNVAAAAPALEALAPLLLAYPPPLRDRLLPIAVDALIDGGKIRTAERLLQAAPQGGEPLSAATALARSRLAEAEGRIAEALAGYDAVARGRDRLSRARAIRRAIELRLATGQMDAAQAAEQLDASLYAWRGEAEEVDARRRLADLLRQAGRARDSFGVLEETIRLFPEREPDLREAQSDALLAAIEAESPVAAVALFEAHSALLPSGPRAERVVALLVERLAALDLHDRAERLLEAQVERAQDPTFRAGLGARLAALRLERNDAGGALMALGDTAIELPDTLAVQRGLLHADALARRGDRSAAEEELRRLGAQGAAALAHLRAEAQDWAGAAAALAEHLEASIPPAPAPLREEDRQALARVAAYAALAGDEARLAALRAAYGPRLQDGPLAETFALLTADPLRHQSSPPRPHREIELARTVPVDGETPRTVGPVAR